MELNTVWKIGSKYGDYGSILDVFYKNQIVFAGNNQHRIREICKGDLIAVAEGFSIVAIGRVIGQPKPIEKFDLNDEEKCTFGGSWGKLLPVV